MWSKIFDIPAYIATVGLFIYGLLGLLRGEVVEEGESSPMFYIILFLFLAMFIFGSKRYRRFQEKMDDRDKPTDNR